MTRVLIFMIMFGFVPHFGWSAGTMLKIELFRLAPLSTGIKRGN